MGTLTFDASSNIYQEDTLLVDDIAPIRIAEPMMRDSMPSRFGASRMIVLVGGQAGNSVQIATDNPTRKSLLVWNCNFDLSPELTMALLATSYANAEALQGVVISRSTGTCPVTIEYSGEIWAKPVKLAAGAILSAANDDTMLMVQYENWSH